MADRFSAHSYLCLKFGFSNQDQGELESTVTGSLALKANDFLVGVTDFNGAVVISHHGRVILHKAYGWLNHERTKPVTTLTPFWIASISKQFAAAGILKLVQQGKL